MIDTEYVENLEHFLTHSEEDRVDSATFLKHFQKTGSTLTWLDVGAGPGTKPVNILEGVDNLKGLLQQYDRIILDILEPSQAWQQSLLQNFKDNKLEHTLRNKHTLTWENFDIRETYDLITLFHSVYGIDTESLSRIPDYLKPNGCACIAVESPKSDLHQIKKRIFPYLHHQELASSSETIAQFFRDRGIKHEVSQDEPDQKFYVDELLDDNNLNRIKPLSFILQTKPEDHNKLISTEIQSLIREELEKRIKTDEKGIYINVPDRFIWVYK